MSRLLPPFAWLVPPSRPLIRTEAPSLGGLRTEHLWILDPFRPPCIEMFNKNSLRHTNTAFFSVVFEQSSGNSYIDMFFLSRPNIAKSMGDSCQSTWGFQKSTARLIVGWIMMHLSSKIKTCIVRIRKMGCKMHDYCLYPYLSLYLLEFFPCKSLPVSSAYLCPLGRCGTTSNVYNATCRIGRLVDQQKHPILKDTFEEEIVDLSSPQHIFNSYPVGDRLDRIRELAAVCWMGGRRVSNNETDLTASAPLECLLSLQICNQQQ